ncbi:MAG: ABC transporter substrate-binding protein [bacterium]|nr:ABC transporter substrate-binding protein [bacterium]MCM1373917.1 ABC transporter substrate-binding protein [Muribaculum sp.]
MKRIRLSILLLLSAVLYLSGCTHEDNARENNILDPAQEEYWYDRDIELESLPTGYMKHDILLTETSVMEFAVYENDNSTGYDCELSVTDFEGQQTTMEWKCGPGESVMGMGYIIGSDDFLTVEGNCRMQDKPERWSLCTYDKKGAKKNEVEVTDAFQNSSLTAICRIAKDKNGNAHIFVYDWASGQSEYKILKEDKVIFSIDLEDCSFEKFIPVNEGRIAFETKEASANAANRENGQYLHKVSVFDESTDAVTLLYEYDEIDQEGKNRIDATGVLDSERLIYATNAGLYLADYFLGNSVQISSYDTQAFGASPRVISMIRGGSEGFWVLMERIMTGGAKPYLQHYSKLSDQMQTVELALNMTAGADIYSEAIVEYNKEHPDKKIVVKSDYDPTTLRTKLISGDGPVLVDSSLLSFAGNEDMWEPLDSLYGEDEVAGNIREEVKELLSVNGKSFAVSVDYYISTMVSSVIGEDMNYSQLLQYLSENKNVKYLMNNELVPDVPNWLAVGMFGGNTEDSFFIDKKTGETRFKSDDFDTMLAAIDALSPKGGEVKYFEGMESGEVLYNFVSINTPIDLFFWNEMSKQGINIVGIPKNDGAKNEICISHSLMIRKSASAEEKETAMEFLKLLLSKEMQLKMMQSPNFHLSIRNDVLAEQILSVQKGDRISMSFFTTERDFLVENPDYSEVESFWNHIMADAVSGVHSEEGYKSILSEEFEDYFKGNITREMLKDHLENRVNLYLREQ